jgi:Glutathione S-transferase N-terminal domain
MDTRETATTTVYRGWPGSGQYVWSPFVIKLELRLRLDGIKYTTDGGSLSNAPKGKFPYVTISLNDEGNTISLADSTLIIKKLTEDGMLSDINAKLSPEDKAHDLALRALFEDRLYFCHVRTIPNLRLH